MKLKLTLLVGFAVFAGCAGGKARLSASPEERLVVWADSYKEALAVHADAKTPAEITQALDRLAAATDNAPIPEARAMAEKDTCIAAAAAGDAAVLTKFNCEQGALNKLIGGY